MKLAPIILHLRERQTSFGNYIAGSVELDIAIKNTLKTDLAFVVPLSDECPANTTDSGITQKITERFAVIVALGNDSTDKDKTGLTAYNKLHDIRSELFRSLLGWQIIGAESMIYYAGGKFVVVQADYLWWEFDFEFETRLTEFDGYADLQGSPVAIGTPEGSLLPRVQVSQLDSFDKIHTDYIMWPHDSLPWQGEIPVNDGTITQMETWVDLTKDIDDGAFARGFGSEYDFYRILNRRFDQK